MDPVLPVDPAAGFPICPKCKCFLIDGCCNCGAEPVVEAPKAEDKPAEQAPAAPAEPEVPVFHAKDALKALPGSPSDEQIAAWKAQFGKIYTFPFDRDEIFIWRPLNRREWQIFTANEGLMKDEGKFQEQVVLRAVLFPILNHVALNMSRAGTISTLFNIILQGSYFIPNEVAIQLVEEL